MKETKQVNHYEVLDVSMSAKPELIRTAYIRAKNTYARDSLAAYTLFDQDESRRILEQIEEAYNVLSDPERRQKYDEAHGYMSFSGGPHKPTPPESVQREPDSENLFAGDLDQRMRAPVIESTAVTTAAPSPIERLQSQSGGLSSSSFGGLRSYRVQRSYQESSEMEEKLKRAENVTGAFLKEAREYKLATLEEMMDLTKMSKAYLLSLESDELGKFPAAVYVRGFVFQYAKALGLDTEKITNSYMSYFKSKRP